MSTRTRAAGLLTALTMTALLAACSSSDTGGSSDGGSDASSSYDMDAGNSAGGQAPGGATRDFADGDATTSSPSSESGSAGGPGTPQMERAVVSTGTVSLSNTDVAATRQDVQRIVDAQGGDVTEENSETDDAGRTSYVRFVVRVPSGRFGEAMTALEGVDGVVTSSRGSDDVTTQVIDNDARVRAQEASLKRVELLLAEAKSLKNLIWIESQLTTRQAELDSLKSQQSWLGDQTSLSTITVDISQKKDDKKAVAEEKDEPAGFLDGLRGGTKALGSTVAAIGLIVGALLPFAVVALVVGVPVWLVVRRRRTPQPAPTDTTVA